MSFKYAHAGVYRCDAPGCGEKKLAPDGELPEGWTIHDPGYSVADAYRQHRCPKCQPPEQPK